MTVYCAKIVIFNCSVFKDLGSFSVVPCLRIWGHFNFHHSTVPPFWLLGLPWYTGYGPLLQMMSMIITHIISMYICPLGLFLSENFYESLTWMWSSIEEVAELKSLDFGKKPLAYPWTQTEDVLLSLKGKQVISDFHLIYLLFNNWFIHQHAFIEIWSTQEVWRAQKMHKSCSRHSWEQL